MLYVPHGPLWDREAPDAAEVLAHLLTGLKTHARARRGIVLKLDPRAPLTRSGALLVGRALLAGGARPAAHDLQAPTTRIVDLAAGDDPTAGWSRDARAELRRSEREGTTVRIDREGTPEALDAFLGLLAETCRAGGLPRRSRAFLDCPGVLPGRQRRLVPGPRRARSAGRWPGPSRLAPPTAPSTCTPLPRGTRPWSSSAARYAVMAALQRALRESGTRSLDLWGVREPDDSRPWTRPGKASASSSDASLGTPLRHPGTFDLVIDARWNRIRVTFVSGSAAATADADATGRTWALSGDAPRPCAGGYHGPSHEDLLPRPHLRRRSPRACRPHRLPLRLGPSPPRPGPAHLHRPARSLRHHPGRAGRGGVAGGARGRSGGALGVRAPGHGPSHARLEGTHNAELPTGDVELRAEQIRILSVARTPPFVINDPDAQIDEAVRLHYRYLDLRREPLQQRILARGRLVQAIRESTTRPGSWRSRRRCSSSPRRRAPATSWSRRGSSRATSTRCPRARSSSSSCSWSRAWTATSRSRAASATRTCAATASRSSPSWTWR